MKELWTLQKMRAGDSSGLEALMDAYTSYVSAIVWNILRGAMSPEDAEEVVSDVFLAAWNQAADLKPGHVKGWLGAVARNKAKRKLRDCQGAIALEDDALDVPGPDSAADEAERTEERRRVQEAVDSLPERDREIFLRHYYYAQTVQEISAATGVNEATVKTRLRRGRMKLKETLTKEGFSHEAEDFRLA